MPVPVYHRVQSTSQTRDDADLQRASGELWGGIPFGGAWPKAQAYVGSLPDGTDGIEFSTEVEPDHGCPPGRAHWSGPRPGVVVEGGYAKIAIKILKVRP